MNLNRRPVIKIEADHSMSKSFALKTPVSNGSTGRAVDINWRSKIFDKGRRPSLMNDPSQ